MNLTPHDQERDRLRRAIEHDRAELDAAVLQLKDVVQERTDVKRFAAERPYAWLIGGFALGWFIGKRKH